MTAIAVIGLGVMGGPMAANLVQAGYDVVGYNRSPDKIDALIRNGGRGAASIAEAVKGAQIVLTVLPDSPDVEEVVAGTDGVLTHAAPGTAWIDSSTIEPKIAQRLAKTATEHGIHAIDAPVSGGEAGARDASLSIMVGGDAADVAKVRPVLEAIGTTIVHVGPSGSGQTVKAANQLIVAGTIELVAEALVFLEAHAVDTHAAVKVLAGGLAGNRILDRKASSMIAREFTPGFRVDLHHKDLGILTTAARQAGTAIPLGTAVAQLMAALRARGHGSLDHTALLLLIDELSGRAGT